MLTPFTMVSRKIRHSERASIIVCGPAFLVTAQKIRPRGGGGGVLLGSAQEHGVAEGEEAVAHLHGLLVRGEDVLAAGEGRNQHDESALRQVEIRHQGVHAFESVTRVDEDVGPAGLGVHGAVLVGKALHSAAGGGADADNAAAGLLRLGDYPRRLLRHDAELGVHLVLLDVLGLDRAEGAEADVQRDEALAHALFGYLRQQLLGKMQSRGGRGGAAQLLGVDGLVALTVLEFGLDIRRERHFAQALEHLEEDAVILELDYPVAAFGDLDDLGLELAVAEHQLGARLGLAARAGQALPAPAAEVAQQQHLDSAAGFTRAEQPRGQDARVVHHEAVALSEQLRQLREHAVLYLARHLVQAQQARSVALLQRGLGNQLLGQVKVKIRCLH